MQLGSLVSVGDRPVHYVTDRRGDQGALPCTERNLVQDAAQRARGRGIMPVVWMKGRNEIRLASFRSLGGEMLMVPWTGMPPPAPKPAPSLAPAAAEPATEEVGDDTDLDDLLAGLDGTDGGGDDDLSGLLGGDAEDDDDSSLDDLLAGFDDASGDDDDDMDPELAALLEGL